MSQLLRIQHGCFTVTDSVPLDVLKESADALGYLQDPVSFLGMPRLTSSPEDARQLALGMKLEGDVSFPGVKLKGNAFYVVCLEGGALLAIAQAEAKRLKPVKVFMRPEAISRASTAASAIESEVQHV
jgi:hypothetical protein